ncbi:MAG: nicotinate (nicotinamide) nucleotide adenylyltransferase [Drouetiella hepatica Uher 2000/2452]|jgi:nicotinate-nucleotide adenylyltransferase|uniref:Probable nicotinate-nucleotide adenylyltransferase n=1 Tax=Drouetiella hepatica Uher 2000/2452 TaxID=904376 RepID=A0A951Q7X0_9CYAN|nr:nicotinate (nicotinamide) nucleotide adenylyltransferase [Drouetiella hepatica Uher 2000/2452]
MPAKAVLGGTFNPIHLGHLLMAETALNQLALEQVIWVPTYRPLYKSSAELVGFKHRLEMLKLAIAFHPSFVVSAIEQNFFTVEQIQPHSSYAVDTFLALKDIHAASQWYWIVGLDTFLTLPYWYRRQELLPHCIWLVAPRLEASVEKDLIKTQALCEQVAQKMAAEAIALNWQILDMPQISLSSQLIRQYCRDRRSIRYLVLDAVRDYILQHNLYKT